MRKKSKRNGVTVMELVVSSLLLGTMLSIFVQSVYQSNRLWKSTHQQQLALDELSNQLEILCIQNKSECEKSLETLKPTESILRTLPEARIQGSLLADDQGTRVVLQITWEGDRSVKPLSLIGWIVPETNRTGEMP